MGFPQGRTLIISGLFWLSIGGLCFMFNHVALFAIFISMGTTATVAGLWKLSKPKPLPQPAATISEKPPLSPPIFHISSNSCSSLLNQAPRPIFIDIPELQPVEQPNQLRVSAAMPQMAFHYFPPPSYSKTSMPSAVKQTGD